MIILPDLPYSNDALEPAISRATLDVHHGKHHAAYVKQANALAEEASLSSLSVEELTKKAKQTANPKLFNNAAQAFNHAFYWQSMTPTKGAPSGTLAGAINSAFGDFATFNTKFAEKGVGHFASGWVWLVSDASGKVSLWDSHDADTILVHEDQGTPLLLCDVWEHAYYLDRKNDRAAYLKAWLENLANWEFAGRQYEAAQGRRPAWTYPSS